MDKELIRFNQVEKEYKSGQVSTQVLKGVNFSIDKGQLAVIVGASGAGKSTILNLLGGMDTPTRGKILVDGEDISKFNEKKLTEYRASKVGFVFQFYNLIPNLNALENVVFGSEVKKDSLDASQVHYLGYSAVDYHACIEDLRAQILLAAPAPRLYGELLVRFAFGLGTRFVSREHLSDNFLAFFVGDDHPQKSHYEICYDRHYGIDVLIYDAAVCLCYQKGDYQSEYESDDSGKYVVARYSLQIVSDVFCRSVTEASDNRCKAKENNSENNNQCCAHCRLLKRRKRLIKRKTVVTC